MHRVVLQGRGDFREWRDSARVLLRAGVAPETVEWSLVSGEGGLFGDTVTSLPVTCDSGPVASVPAAFLSLAETVICHSDPGRFALLYRLLFQVVQDRDLLQIHSDVDVAAAHRLVKSVRRDSHKMKAFVRFKEMAEGEGARRRFVAWFEPDHFIVARTAPFFQRRFTDMDWLILTPQGSAAWDGSNLATSDVPAQKPDLEDATDDLWRTYYASIFNPARLKVKMMTTEMPKKYWRNLPEAELIPALIASAETRVMQMAEREATMPPAFHTRVHVPEVVEMPAAAGSLEELRREARTCTLCPLHCKATQTVFGEGPELAEVMIVGEQPGDEEDLAGRPFVGPAGRLLNGVLQETGIDRSSLYLTNAVKHFKYEPRGKRRIHQKPNAGEVQKCRWWLGKEIELIKPKRIVAMGATALGALTGKNTPLSAMRGEHTMPGGHSLLVTVHPAYLLRLPDEGRRREEMQRFTEDFRRLAEGIASEPPEA